MAILYYRDIIDPKPEKKIEGKCIQRNLQKFQHGAKTWSSKKLHRTNQSINQSIIPSINRSSNRWRKSESSKQNSGKKICQSINRSVIWAGMTSGHTGLKAGTVSSKFGKLTLWQMSLSVQVVLKTSTSTSVATRAAFKCSRKAWDDRRDTLEVLSGVCSKISGDAPVSLPWIFSVYSSSFDKRPPSAKNRIQWKCF